MPIHNRPVFSETFESIADFRPNEPSVYIRAQSVELRSDHVEAWSHHAGDVEFVEIVAEERHSFTVKYADDEQSSVALRSGEQIRAFWARASKSTIYIDITGLRHHVWAILVRSALETRGKVVVIYVEPKDYRPSLTPTENQIYDLSEKIEGIAPLPGFATTKEMGEKSFFVPLLGFEGTRLSHMISQLEPLGRNIIPIIGLPGFRPEYPFATYMGNRSALVQNQAWRKIRYASANCPFDLYYLLQDIHKLHPDYTLKIAPIGTKPHALGGVLYAIANQASVELVYDHPVRKAQRTAGTARLLAYHVSSLFG